MGYTEAGVPSPIREDRTELPGRSISECIALAKKHEGETGEAPALDHDFAADVEEIVGNRRPRATKR
jgi:hypothetical protein